MWRRLAPGVLLFCILGCVDRPAADASGAEIYKAVCARCHDDDLSGGLGPALGGNSNAAEQDDAFLRLTISDGRGRMPSFQNTLSEDQIDRVIDYLRSEQE